MLGFLTSNPALRLVRGVIAFVTLVRDPQRTDRVFKLVDEISDPHYLGPMRDRMRTVARGAAAFDRRLRLGRVDLSELARLPEGTLGRTFAEHMLRLGLDPEFFPKLNPADELTYMRLHLYETHDLWHVTTGIGTDVQGELALQAFYLAQFPSPLAPIILSAGLLHVLFYDFGSMTRTVTEIVRGWNRGQRAELLFGVDWSAQWWRPLAELRAELRLDGDGNSDAVAAA